MRHWSLLLCLLLLTACSAPGSAPDSPPVSVPSLPPTEVPRADTQPVAEAPPRPLGPVDIVLAEADLTRDGLIEDVVITDYGMIRIFSRKSADSLTEIFTYQLPIDSDQGVRAQVFPLPDRPPLLNVNWGGCPYGYPDNLFVWQDRQTGKLITDRDPNAGMGPCGAYSPLGDGRFEAVFRHNELVYTRTEAWQENGLVMEGSTAAVIRFEIARLPDVLTMLADQEITNPEFLFATVDLYAEFRAQAHPGMAFTSPASTEPDTLVLEVTKDGQQQGQLKVVYETETESKAWIKITHLEWLSWTCNGLT